MAKKKTVQKPKNIADAVGFRSIINNEKTDFLLGIVLLLVALYLIIAMISYFYTGAADQSILENMKPREWVNTDKIFSNYCGSLGAIIAYNLITVNFGYPAFFVPVFIALVGLQLMRAYRLNLWKYFLGMALVMI